MKWLQHNSDALEDRKLVDLAMKYGAEGIGVYWVVVERIAKKMEPGNLTLELEEETFHLVRLCGDRTPGDRIDAILKFCEDIKLFDRGCNGRIRCLTLLRKLDNTSKKTPEYKKMVEDMKRFNPEWDKSTSQVRRDDAHIHDLQDQQTDLPIAVESKRGERDRILIAIGELEQKLKAWKGASNPYADEIRRKIKGLEANLAQLDLLETQEPQAATA